MTDDNQKGTENKEDQEDKEGKKDEPSKSSQPSDLSSDSSATALASAEALAKEGPSKPKAKVGKKLEAIIKDIEELSVLELSELVKALEAKFGVTAAPQVAMAPSGQTAQAGGEEVASEQTTFNVVLADSGTNKISVIKALREINPQLGLKEAKDLVDAPPKEILTGVNKETSQEAKTKLEAAGAKVELK